MVQIKINLIRLNKVKEEIEKSKLRVPVKKQTLIEKSEHLSDNQSESENESEDHESKNHRDSQEHHQSQEIEKRDTPKNHNYLEVEHHLERDMSHSELSKDDGTRSQTSLFPGKERKKSRIISSDTPGFESLNLYEQLEILESESDYVVYTTFYDGDSFGELALINNSPRSATIVCSTDWTFATMDKNDYWKTLSRIESRNINKVIDFFKSLPYFSNFSRTAITKIRFNFRKIKYKCNHVIYREGESSEHAYIVINGDFELEKIK